MLAGAQGVEFLAPLEPGRGVAAAHRFVRSLSPRLLEDRQLGAEIDAVAVRRCESIVVDSNDQARIEAGDFVQALEDGSIHWADVHELGQVIVGRYTGRAHPQDVTLFKSLGIAIEDVALAAKVYAKAQAEGVGRVLEW